MNNRICFGIKEDEYQRFVGLIGISDQLPATYKEWLELKKNEDINVTVTFQGYNDYVNTSGLSFNWATLSAYVIYANATK